MRSQEGATLATVASGNPPMCAPIATYRQSRSLESPNDVRLDRLAIDAGVSATDSGFMCGACWRGQV